MFASVSKDVQQPMKRKIACLMGLVPWLSACSGYGYEENVGYNSTPFLYTQPSISESANKMFADTKTSRLRQRFGSKKVDWNEIAGVTTTLLQRAVSLGHLEPKTGVGHNGFSTLVDKRIFLVSIKPDIVLLVPHAYRMQEGLLGKPPYWHSGGIDIQLGELQDGLRKKYALRYNGVGLQPMGLTNHAELSSIFPGIEGIEVVSDKWGGVITLAQMIADTSIPFKVIPAAGMPGFSRMVLKDSGKTSP